MSDPSFYDALTQAVSYFSAHGYSSSDELLVWQKRLREAAERSLISQSRMVEMLRDNLGATYRRLVDRDGLMRMHPGVERFTIDHIKPQLRAELDRRILASADLIKLNREASIQRSLQRFSGWATSIPAGGSETVEKIKQKELIRRSVAGLPFEERRVIIDQGHKLVSAINDITATAGGAIAAEWNSHWRQSNYNYRKGHKERDGKVYAIRGNWALEKGLMKAGDAGYTDEITAPGEEVYCRCFYRYIYSIEELPDDMKTKKGREALERAKEIVARL